MELEKWKLFTFKKAGSKYHVKQNLILIKKNYRSGKKYEKVVSVGEWNMMFILFNFTSMYFSNFLQCV